MKVAIAADFQFDEQPSRSSLSASGISTRLVDSIDCFDWIVRVARERGCEHLFSLGDIFDSREAVRLPVLDQVCRAYDRAAEYLEHHILVGNHDAALRTPEINSTQVFSGLGTVVEEPLVFGPFAFMPWVEDPDDFHAGVAELAKSDARFLFSHIMVEGAVPKAYGYSMDVLMVDRWERIILGDVHDPVSLLDGKVRYCGSPMQWHYGDAGGKRGFLLLDTDTAEVEFIENTFSPRFHIINDMTLASPRAYKAAEVAPRDFVQIRVTDPYEAAEVAQALSKCASVETMAVALEHDEPRIAVRSSDPHKAVLERYVEHIEDQEDLDLGAAYVDVGLELLQEAKSL